MSEPSVRLLSWNTKDPNTAGLIRLADVFALDRLLFVRKPEKMGAAVGTQKRIPHEVTHDPMPVLQSWRDEGYTIVAIEQADHAGMLGSCELPERVAFVLGNEGSGMPAKVLDFCDFAVEIPQWGLCSSLNVAVAGGIVLYEWARQWRVDCPRSVNAWGGRKRTARQAVGQ